MSRVRENRTHGSTGRGWKRSTSYRASPSPNQPRPLGYANTYKHHTRDRGVEARIASTKSGSSRGGQVFVDWTNPATGAGGRVDALDLATNCMQAWRGYLAKHGLDPRLN